MTEPTPETLWRDLLEKDDRTSPEVYPDMALITFDEFCYCIEALTEQRVAAAVQEERERCAGIAHRRRPAVAGWAHDATVAIEREIRIPADRTGPEGAAPTANLARRRCLTPSQEDTGSVSGDRWRPIDSAPEDGTVVWVYVASAHGLPAFQGSCAYHRDGGWCADELRPVTHWVPIECVYMPPPNAAGGPGSASNTEPSPTQTVAPPGPTAGDVERARKSADRAHERLMARLSQFNGIQPPEVITAIHRYRDAVSASARAELLAQLYNQRGDALGAAMAALRDIVVIADDPLAAHSAATKQADPVEKARSDG